MSDQKDQDTPGHPTARQSSRRHFLESQIASLQGDDITGTRVKPLDKSPASAITGAPQFGPCALTPDFFAVNTMASRYWPPWIRDPEHPNY